MHPLNEKILELHRAVEAMTSTVNRLREENRILAQNHARLVACHEDLKRRCADEQKQLEARYLRTRQSMNEVAARLRETLAKLSENISAPENRR